MFNEIVDVKMRQHEIAGKKVQCYLIAEDTEANLWRLSRMDVY